MMLKLALSITLAALSAPSSVAQHPGQTAGEHLSRTIDNAMEADGPWLLPAERALIARKCGYAPDAQDSDSISMNNGTLICSNGRRVDDPEVRAMVEVASARISRRVSAVMASPAVRGAIAAVSDEAVREALESLRDNRPRRRRR